MAPALKRTREYFAGLNEEFEAAGMVAWILNVLLATAVAWFYATKLQGDDVPPWLAWIPTWSEPLVGAIGGLLTVAAFHVVRGPIRKERRARIAAETELAAIAGGSTWTDDWQARFNAHVPEMHRLLDVTYRRYRKRRKKRRLAGEKLPKSWRELVQEVQSWPLCATEAEAECPDLFHFATAVYDPSAPDSVALKKRSVVPDGLFERFHDEVRRDIAHYLGESGVTAQSSKQFAYWVAGRVATNTPLVLMVCLLAIPLRMHTHGTGDIRHGGMGWFVNTLISS